MQQAPLSAQAQRDLDSDETVYMTWWMQTRRWNHVLNNPNAKAGERAFYAMLESAVKGKRVLEIGCSTGHMAPRILSYGASYVLGTDISEQTIATANRDHAVPGVCEFRVLDATIPFQGTFDVIFGHAVLHHFAYRDVLLRLQRDNLAPDGQMIFVEPLAANVCMRVFRRLTRNAHTRDEHPFTRTDIRWLRQHFPHFTFLPINYVSVPLGAVSSLLLSSSDNPLLRAADRIDRLVAGYVPLLHYRFRCAVLCLK